jgi:hypothetical protein
LHITWERRRQQQKVVTPVSLSPTPDFHSISSGSFAAAATQKILPVSLSTGAAAVVGAFTAAAALPGRRMIRVTNDDPSSAFRVGNSAIAAGAGGVTIFPKLSADFYVTAEVPLYVIADALTPLVSWMEFA